MSTHRRFGDGVRTYGHSHRCLIVIDQLGVSEPKTKLMAARLQELGYTHDSSVTPYRNWYDQVDFSQPGSLTPYYPSFEDICVPGQTQVLEVPVSITPELEWLRPTPRFSDTEKCLRVIDWYEAHTSPTVLCCMFHNVELVAGMSPYCKTDDDCLAMLGRIETVFRTLESRGYAFKTLSQVTLDG